ncbi:2189_t:CDS:2 [Paraglomus occultum]|uniref:2189_t:CDS:1 n=1 Tax=Paraglomus occultum TaxID=144539 RepID=A0A9N8YZ09_9GLOM|nr:2189_t:CDS:2 [Paraglomus occultum]
MDIKSLGWRMEVQGPAGINSDGQLIITSREMPVFQPLHDDREKDCFTPDVAHAFVCLEENKLPIRSCAHFRLRTQQGKSQQRASKESKRGSQRPKLGMQEGDGGSVDKILLIFLTKLWLRQHMWWW